VVVLQWGTAAPVDGSSPPESVIFFFCFVSTLLPSLFLFYFLLFRFVHSFSLLCFCFALSPLLCSSLFFVLSLFLFCFSPLYPLLALLSLGSFFFFFISVPLCFPSHNITLSFLSPLESPCSFLSFSPKIPSPAFRSSPLFCTLSPSPVLFFFLCFYSPKLHAFFFY